MNLEIFEYDVAINRYKDRFIKRMSAFCFRDQIQWQRVVQFDGDDVNWWIAGGKYSNQGSDEEIQGPFETVADGITMMILQNDRFETPKRD